MRLNHSVASEPCAVVPLTQSHDVSHPEVGSSLRAVFWCAAFLWLPSVSGQSAGLAPTRDTRRGSTVALGASIHEIGAEVRQPQSGDVRGEEVEVQPGDTASEIAVVRLPAEVALDQMLVALLRRNPEVFVGGNVNRLPAGAILKIPDASTAAAIPLAEARRMIAEQNREYEAFRVALASRFRMPLEGRSNRVEVLVSSVESQATQPRSTGDASGSLKPSIQPADRASDVLARNAPSEQTHGGIGDPSAASAVPTQASAMVQAATPVLDPLPTGSPEPQPSALTVVGNRFSLSQFVSRWSWVVVFGFLAVAWGWFRSKRKAQPTVPQQRAEVSTELAPKSEPQPSLAPILESDTRTGPAAPSTPWVSAPDEALDPSKAPASSPLLLTPPVPSLKPAGLPNRTPPPAAEPRRVAIPKPVDATANSLPEPGRRQRLQEEAELARLMAALKKEQAYQSDREQALEIRLRRLAGLIEENERRNQKAGFASRSYRWLLMALAEPGLKDNDPQRDLKLRLLIEIRDFNRHLQGRVAPVTQLS